jgi:hypothetical protein
LTCLTVTDCSVYATEVSDIPPIRLILKNFARPVTSRTPHANNQIEQVITPIKRWGHRNGNLSHPTWLTSSKLNGGVEAQIPTHRLS